ncbi:hypothetical protein [Metabacillus bambusae]|uniref:AraC family transcriptional regulator n=1 Tax=Metabacillus bambusae TaxID=2795218 RepID=A0ABS3N9Y0_9BACI|nr:hypothetical protein [Metabacillus bambusae]MBO1515028.1 hypothetical protein [Metabacillus bambusae]
MLQGICVDTENTVVLQKGESYYLFPNGPDHYYVSRFPNEGAHTGCFQVKHFELIDEEEKAMPGIDRDKVYFAQMYCKVGYPSFELKEYYIKPRKTHCNLYEDQALTRFKGCFPLEWFTDFEEIVTETNENDHIVEGIEFRSAENGQLLLF